MFPFLLSQEEAGGLLGLHEGDGVEVCDEWDVWRQGLVVAVQGDSAVGLESASVSRESTYILRATKVRSVGWGGYHDEWVALDSGRLALPGTHLGHKEGAASDGATEGAGSCWPRLSPRATATAEGTEAETDDKDTEMDMDVDLRRGKAATDVAGRSPNPNPSPTSNRPSDLSARTKGGDTWPKKSSDPGPGPSLCSEQGGGLSSPLRRARRSLGEHSHQER
ncbi:unnamed protein product, partial [Discosporangium mesarthrocarpum]